MTARRPDWMLDEVASAGRENLDANHVGRYDSKMDASAATEVDLLAQLGMTAGSSLVEFGVGTGQFTLEAANRGVRVTVVDVSPAMLGLLREKVAAQDLGNIEVVEAGFLTYEREPASVDFVYSRLALHHLPDFWKVHALQRIHDMLRPGGAFRLWDVVYDFDPRDATASVEAWCATGRDVPLDTPLDDGWGRWEIAEHVRNEHSTYSWLVEAMFDRTGFIVERRDQPDATTGRYVLRKAD